MIQIESVYVEEFRGIRELTLTLDRGSFVVSGPNGSGKSGVVDAIQFALTGEIGRLRGAGTADLSLTDHGPHVESRSDPESAFVRLKVFIPHLEKSATITRNVKKPRNPVIVPSDDSVKAVFSYLELHPEVTLSRREIIKFILAEATQRSRDVQTLLKLDDIDQMRATLKTAENKLNSEYQTARTQSAASQDSLKRHLDLASLNSDDVLGVINKKRSLLGLQLIAELKKDSDLAEGLSTGEAQDSRSLTKETALKDLKALTDAASNGFETPTIDSVNKLLTNVAKLEEDPALLTLMKRNAFYQTGLEMVDASSCPLCDSDWDISKLRAHLQDKLEKSKGARIARDQIIESGQKVSAEIVRLRGLIEPLLKLPEMPKEILSKLSEWSGGLVTFSKSLLTLDGIIGARDHFQSGWAATPTSLKMDIESVRAKVQARPDKSATKEASSYLVLAQERMNNLRLARRTEEERKASAALGRTAYKIYCEVSEAALLTLYEEVEQEFGGYYQFINQDDEGEFKAKFEATDGKLGLLVDFHKRGMFPPAAYHSEGHQDGMGVCLYLALMRRVLEGKFTFAVFDDVVMSVDSQHRKQFCKLLKTKFPNTQFIITTHDQVWARQLRTEGVVGSKSAVAFHTWAVETGPILDEIADIWDKIDSDLAKNDVPAAAGRMRRHLEYVAADLADELAAKVSFKGDGNYDMGELLSAVIGRQGELLKLALRAAKSWADTEQIGKVDGLLENRAQILTAKKGEEWIVNKAVHYNEWADLSRNDFKPVVTAFKELLQQFRCDKPKCGSWLSLTPRFNPVDLRCSCGAFRLNLKER